MKTLRELFGERVRALRKAQGLSQMDLGRKSDLHFTFIGSIERSETSAGVDSIQKLAVGLEVEPAELFRFPTKGKSASEKEKLLMELTAWGKEQDEERLQKLLNIVEEIWG